MQRIEKDLYEYIVGDLLFGQAIQFGREDSFLANGLIDSTGILELVSFVEEKYDISIEEDELIPENLDSVANLTMFLGRKLGRPMPTEAHA